MGSLNIKLFRENKLEFEIRGVIETDLGGLDSVVIWDDDSYHGDKIPGILTNVLGQKSSIRAGYDFVLTYTLDNKGDYEISMAVKN